MESDTLCYLSLQDLSTHLRTDKLSSVKVTRCILDRIHRINPRLHAYFTVLDESALQRAAQADKEIRGGHWRGPLHGGR
jgi:Asp-tRNA(Asn)/Glu-tRNA(Gln) amidotransferase A subunit family amidase